MKLCVVTCTGGRPELFALCRRWVERQIRKPDLWLVFSDLDDEPPPLPSFASFARVPKRPDSFTAIHSDPAWAIFHALQFVPAGYAAIPMEDDDWYGANHCAKIMGYLERGSMISYGSDVYYFHVPAARWQWRKGEHSTEGCIGLHPDAVERWRRSLTENPRWDPKDGVYDGFTKVDIKGVGHGLPGRHGATNRHNPDHKKGLIMRPDPGYKKFIGAVGREDAQAYINLVQPCQPTKR